MKRREFVGGALVGSIVWGSTAGGTFGQNPIPRELPGPAGEEGVVIEPPLAGRPHVGKVLAAIQSHADDVPLFAGGNVAKLISEGYSGCLIRTTNDNKTGGGTVGEGTLSNLFVRPFAEPQAPAISFAANS